MTAPGDNEVARRAAYQRMPQMERTPGLEFNRGGIHDHHFHAARTDAERVLARQYPHLCYTDDRCWWNGGGDER